jgi:hypothetical protein
LRWLKNPEAPAAEWRLLSQALFKLLLPVIGGISTKAGRKCRFTGRRASCHEWKTHCQQGRASGRNNPRDGEYPIRSPNAIGGLLAPQAVFLLGKISATGFTLARPENPFPLTPVFLLASNLEEIRASFQRI